MVLVYKKRSYASYNHKLEAWITFSVLSEAHGKAGLWNGGFMDENVVSISRWNDNKLDSWKEEHLVRSQCFSFIIFFELYMVKWLFATS